MHDSDASPIARAVYIRGQRLVQAQPGWVLGLIGFVGVLFAVCVLKPLISWLMTQAAVSVPLFIKLPPPPEAMAAPHLSRADAECRQIIDSHVQTLDAFFADAKQNTRAFAISTLGWTSKWKLVADQMPGTSGDGHATYIREQFAHHIFAPQQLEQAVEQVVSSYLQHIESIEGRMLVELQADMADFPTAFSIGQLDEQALQVAFQQAIQQATQETGDSLRADLAQQMVSLIAGEVLTQVALKLGVSAGLLGTGAGSSWATFGVGVVVGVIVDQIVTWVWDWCADPTGTLAAQVETKLDEIRLLIIDGADGSGGLRERLEQLATERASVRQAAVISLLQMTETAR